ncbi:hypothetical protein [Photorhabdus khanii]|uniref:Uncharacterized protein n=1 Tax=Photorhabdus khanii subsp. guanajuatensis TaxID=2100166 RepID=A0A4V2X3S9_9GAMM|nr:hypothetical protein [Photorhabdus khanii]TDB41615.1 hypothetical protein C5467_24410 [Photorhabdus khanii subsp. guanajuatensis]
MKTTTDPFVTNALKLVLEAIELHRNGKLAPLSIDVLNKVKVELEEMIRVMNPKVYTPSYPRFISDWPDEFGLIEKLISVAYYYKKIKKD